MNFYCMYFECVYNEDHGETDFKLRKPAKCKMYEESDEFLMVARWVSLNLVELHKVLELFPTCAFAKLEEK